MDARDAALARFNAAKRAGEVQKLRVDAVHTDEAFQPRVDRLVPFREKGRTSERSDEHIATMRLTLEAPRAMDLEPIWVACIDGVYFIVDGHHRLKAYQLAKRETIPALVCSMGRDAAVWASKFANFTPRALEMHEEHRREVAWQWTAKIYRKHNGLPDSESLRSVAGRFGISKDTVARMLRRLPKIDVRDYSEEACDPHTKFPRWRYVRPVSNHWQDLRAKMTMEELTRHKAEKLAARIGKALDKEPPEVQRLAMDILAAEAREAMEDSDSVRALAYGDDGDF